MKITVGTTSGKLSEFLDTAGVLTKVQQIGTEKIITFEVQTSSAIVYFEYGDTATTSTGFPLEEGAGTLNIALENLYDYSVIGSGADIDVRLLVM